MKCTITREEFKKMFYINQDRTVSSYIKRGILKPIGSRINVFDRKRVFVKLGIMNEPNEPFVTNSDVCNVFNIKDNGLGSVAMYVRRHRIPCYSFVGEQGSKRYYLRSQLEKCILAKEIGVEFEYTKLVNGKNIIIRTNIVGGNNGRKGKKITQFDLRGNIVRHYSCAREAEEFGISKGSIDYQCRERTRSTGIYAWRYFEDIHNLNNMPKEELLKTLFYNHDVVIEEDYYSTRKIAMKKKIKQMDWNGDIKNIFSYVHEMKQAGFYANSIQLLLKKNVQVKYKGFIWEYV